MARKARKSRRRAPVASKKRSRRRSGGGFRRRGFISRDMITGASGVIAGFVGPDMIMRSVPIPQLQSGTGRIFGKVVIGLGAAYFLRGRSPGFAASLAAGTIAAGALDFYYSHKPQAPTQPTPATQVVSGNGAVPRLQATGVTGFIDDDGNGINGFLDPDGIVTDQLGQIIGVAGGDDDDDDDDE
jgi:hypothetical protein